MAWTTARLSNSRGRPPALGGGINLLIQSHSASVRSVEYGLGFIPKVYRTDATYRRLFKQPPRAYLTGTRRVLGGTNSRRGQGAITVTAMVTVPTSGGVPLSVTVTTRLSLPVKFSAGVYITRPLASTLAVPCTGGVVTAKVTVCPTSGSLGRIWLVLDVCCRCCSNT